MNPNLSTLIFKNMIKYLAIMLGKYDIGVKSNRL